MIHAKIQRICLLLAAPLVSFVLIGAVGKGGARAPVESTNKPAVKAAPSGENHPVVRPSTNTPPAVSAAQPVIPAPRPVVEPVAASATYEVRWSSVNAGGGRAVSPNYASSTSSGQTTAGTISSPSFEAGGGFWEGTEADTSSVICTCSFQCDFDETGALDALDLNSLIEALFFAGANPQDPQCPATRGDFNNDGAPDALDLNDLIEHLFFGGAPPVDPCSP